MFSLKETVDFHKKMCGFIEGVDLEYWITKAGLSPHLNKRIKTYSSGMQQRVRLLLAIASPRPLLLLDEPTSNLDNDGVAFYQELIKELATDKTIIVASNYIEHEYDFCDGELLLEKALLNHELALFICSIFGQQITRLWQVLQISKMECVSILMVNRSRSLNSYT